MATHLITSRKRKREEALIEDKFPYREPPHPANPDRFGPGVKIVSGVAVPDSRPNGYKPRTQGRRFSRSRRYMEAMYYANARDARQPAPPSLSIPQEGHDMVSALLAYYQAIGRDSEASKAKAAGHAIARYEIWARAEARERNGSKVLTFPATTPKPKPKPEQKPRPTVAPFTPAKPSPSKPAALNTELMHALRGRGTTAKSMSHIVVTADLSNGRLKRRAGDPLCKPLDKFPYGLTHIVPHNDPVCPRCAELAERYDLPLPGNVEVTLLPSSRKLGPDDPQVTYKPNSKWFNYNFGFPFNGYLRQWGWLRNHCICKQCGAPISTERGSELVKGMELFDYYVCTSGHPIRDERDLKRSDRMPKEAGSADQVLEGYPWLKAVVPDDDIPF